MRTEDMYRLAPSNKYFKRTFFLDDSPTGYVCKRCGAPAEVNITSAHRHGEFTVHGLTQKCTKCENQCTIKHVERE